MQTDTYVKLLKKAVDEHFKRLLDCGCDRGEAYEKLYRTLVLTKK